MGPNRRCKVLRPTLPLVPSSTLAISLPSGLGSYHILKGTRKQKVLFNYLSSLTAQSCCREMPVDSF